VIHACTAGRQLLRCLAPVLILLVVQHMVGAQLLQPVALLLATCRRNDLAPGRLCKLQREDTDPACALRQYPVARLDRLVGQPIQRVPRRQTRACQARALDEVQVRRLVNEAFFGVGAVLAERAVNNPADAGRGAGEVELACQMSLIEERDDLVARFEAGDAVTNGGDGPGAIGGGYNMIFLREWVFSKDDNKIAKV
jgi:hypothetical protein